MCILWVIVAPATVSKAISPCKVAKNNLSYPSLHISCKIESYPYLGNQSLTKISAFKSHHLQIILSVSKYLIDCFCNYHESRTLLCMYELIIEFHKYLQLAHCHSAESQKYLQASRVYLETPNSTCTHFTQLFKRGLLLVPNICIEVYADVL